MKNTRVAVKAAKADETAATMIWLTRIFAVLAALAIALQASGAFAKAAPESFSALAKKLLPTVVNISTTQTVEGRSGLDMPQLPPGSPFEDFFKDFFERNGQQQRPRKATSLGSGFIVGVVGQLQFEVLASRIEMEYGLPVRFEASQFTSARWVTGPKAQLDKLVEANKQHIGYDNDGDPVFLTRLQWDIDRVERDNPEIKLTATKEMHGE